MLVSLGTFRLNLLFFQPFQELDLFMANVQGTLTTLILRPQRMSPSADEIKTHENPEKFFMVNSHVLYWFFRGF